MKTCFKCRQRLHPSNFYKHPMMGDGRLGKCKECTKRDVTANREKNVEKIRAYDRARGKLPHRVALVSSGSRRRDTENPVPRRARGKLARAVGRGVVKKQPCAVCGNKKSLGHHDDYSRPLDVIWLCQVHHVARHKMLSACGRDPRRMSRALLR